MQTRPALRSFALAVLASVPLVAGACPSSSDQAPGDAATPARSEPAPAATPPAAANEAPRAEQASAAECPTAVPGATIRATDVEGGVALEVTTTGDVEAVRERARAMAARHERHASDPSAAMPGRGGGTMHGPHGPHGGPMMHGDGHVMARAAVRVEEVDAGARIVFTPRDPEDLEAMRTHARRMAERMAAGRCPAMM
jgi:pyruvate/2-oxoglutarate dehydrogenase complex dihydrolipoamide acyltransferase (E2) component